MLYTKCRCGSDDENTVCVDCNNHKCSQPSHIMKEGSTENLDPAEPEIIDYEYVLSTSNSGEIAIIKSLLNPEGITYYFKGENLVALAAEVSAKLMIKKDELQKAMDILKNLR